MSDKIESHSLDRKGSSAALCSEVRHALTHYIVQAAATYSRGQWNVPEDMIRSAGITAAEIKAVLPKGDARDRVLALLPNAGAQATPPGETAIDTKNT